MGEKETVEPFVVEFMEKHPGKVFSAKQIAPEIGRKRGSISGVLARLFKEGTFPGLERLGQGGYRFTLPKEAKAPSQVVIQAPPEVTVTPWHYQDPQKEDFSTAGPLGAKLKIILPLPDGTWLARDGDSRIYKVTQIDG